MKCVDCHFSPNNPTRNIRDKWEAKYLTYQPPTLRRQDFLLRPDHNITKGDCYPETIADNLDRTMRGCSDCHQAASIHQWLPCRRVHFNKIACETCHIPRKYYWACQQIDLAVYPKGKAGYRGGIGDYKDLKSRVTGFQPAYFLRKTGDGLSSQIVPCNPITALFWFDPENGRPAFPHQVRRAFYQWNERFQLQMLPEAVTFFDKDRDGAVSDSEMRLDSSEKIEFARSLIGRQGIKNPRLNLEIIPFSLNHNIVSKGQAIKDCRECHSRNSRLLAGVEIFDYVPPGVDLTISDVVPSDLKGNSIAGFKEGKVFYSPAFMLENLYIMGVSKNLIIEWVGWLMVLISLVGSLVHGFFRILAHKRRI